MRNIPVFMQNTSYWQRDRNWTEWKMKTLESCDVFRWLPFRCMETHWTQRIFSIEYEPAVSNAFLYWSAVALTQSIDPFLTTIHGNARTHINKSIHIFMTNDVSCILTTVINVDFWYTRLYACDCVVVFFMITLGSDTMQMNKNPNRHIISILLSFLFHVTYCIRTLSLSLSFSNFHSAARLCVRVFHSCVSALAFLFLSLLLCDYIYIYSKSRKQCTMALTQFWFSTETYCTRNYLFCPWIDCN